MWGERSTVRENRASVVRFKRRWEDSASIHLGSQSALVPLFSQRLTLCNTLEALRHLQAPYEIAGWRWCAFCTTGMERYSSQRITSTQNAPLFSQKPDPAQLDSLKLQAYLAISWTPPYIHIYIHTCIHTSFFRTLQRGIRLARLL